MIFDLWEYINELKQQAAKDFIARQSERTVTKDGLGQRKVRFCSSKTPAGWRVASRRLGFDTFRIRVEETHGLTTREVELFREEQRKDSSLTRAMFDDCLVAARKLMVGAI